MSGAEGDSNGVADSHLILSLLLGTLKFPGNDLCLVTCGGVIGDIRHEGNKLISAQPAQDGVIFKYTF